MSTQAHLDALKAKHKALEAQLADAAAHASSSDQELAAIKHEKLQIKDEIAKLEEASAEAIAAQGPLLGIAAKSISNMNIALGGSAFNVDGLNATQVLAEHDRLSVRFQASFKSGGVAAVGASEPIQEAQIDPRHTARVNAARFSK